jgi:hypothetical protein
MVILGPKNYRFGLWDPDLVQGNDIYKYLEYLRALEMGFVGSICLGWVNLAYIRTTVKIPKFLGAASKHYRYM